MLGERYRLRRLLGAGGMGWVWEAVDASIGSNDKPVALKLLKGAKDDDRKRFQREVRAAAAIHHPNVIGVHDFLELPDGTLVIVMDLLEGETLGAVLRRDGRMSLRDLATVALPVVAALEAAHALGIVHRDLKPDNVFLCGTGEELEIKVLDFGVAKLTAEEGLAARTQALTGTGSMVGTPYYMSPEQVYADKDLDARADIWSLGIVIYECLTGRRPTEADTLGRVLKKIMVADFEPITSHGVDVPEDVVSLVGRMLSVDRQNRPRTLVEVRDVLLRHVGPGVTSFSRAPSVAEIDPHAVTVATPRDEPRPPPSDAAPSASAALATEDSVARADTNRGVSIAPERPARARTRLVAVGAIAVVALLGGAVLLRGRDLADRKPPGETASGIPVTTADATATAPASAPASAASAPPLVPSSAPSASTIQSPSGTPSMKPIPPATVVSKPSCEKGEVLSEGHCCPRGHLWRAGRCERPLATSF